MGKAKPVVMGWVATVVIAALLATGFSLLTFSVTITQWLALLLLTSSAAIANVFPIRAAADGATYRLNNVFILAGALVLPAELLTILVALSMAPDLWVRRHRPRILVEWLFNMSQATLATHVAGVWARSITEASPAELAQLADLAAFLGAAGLFTLVQACLVGIIIALDRGVPFLRVPTLSLPALLRASFKTVERSVTGVGA